jgi:hypothetical protein
LVTGAGRLVLAAGGTSGTDIFGGSWAQSAGILQVGASAGSSINALGFKNGDPKQANTITVNGGTLAVGVVGSGPATPAFLRANVTLAGGNIASTNGIDAQYGGDFVVSPGTSKVLVFDPASTSTVRNVSLVAGAAGADNLAAATTWGAGSTLIVDPGATSGGEFNITRSGGTITVGANATFQINPGAKVFLGGSADALSDGVNHVNVVNNSFNLFNVTSGPKNIGDLDGIGLTSVNPGVTLTVNHARQSTLTVGGTVVVRPSAGASGVSRIDVLTIAVGGRFDLQDNKLITPSPVGTFNGTFYTDVSGLIRSGRNGGGWTGSGIVTSQSSATSGNFTSIGVATAAQVKGVAATATATWTGQTVSGSDTLVMYTYGGDANLDGKINVDDYGKIDSSAPLGISGWFNGDFNYDGKINVDDYGIIDFNVGIQGAAFPTSAGLSAVPEPASVIASTWLLSTLASRRGRRRCRG